METPFTTPPSEPTTVEQESPAPYTNTSPQLSLIMTGIPEYQANLMHTIRLFDPDTGNYSGMALPLDVIQQLMRTGHSVYMRIY